MFDFPRLQLVVFGVIVVAAYSLCARQIHCLEKTLIVLMGIALAVQSWQIFPYTPMSSRQVLSAKNKQDVVRIFVANVLQENRNATALLRQIEEANPDVILLNEPDKWWTEQLKALEKHYPNTLLHPRTNTYGMNLYSRFELLEPEVRFLVDTNIPSIRANLKLPGQRIIHFYGVHPPPPGVERPTRDERQDSTQRDAELILVGKEVAKLDEPVIVAGDFNDVAWSHTTRLFQRISRLLDPRVGRGFYNSYNAKLPIFRYPLDHLFHSDHFTLVELKRLKYFGSDHFPIFVVLNLEPDAAAIQEAPQKKPADIQESEKILDRPLQKD